MYTGDGRFLVSFNGEIYNYKELKTELIRLGHKFQTETDTEVLLAAWKQWSVGSLEKLVGMFSFCILDKGEQELFLARDLCIKPLYYMAAENSLFFSSEIIPLIDISSDKKVNLETLHKYLLNGKYDNGEQTFFEGGGSAARTFLRVSFDKVINLDSQRWWWPEVECNANNNLKMSL